MTRYIKCFKSRIIHFKYKWPLLKDAGKLVITLKLVNKEKLVYLFFTELYLRVANYGELTSLLKYFC